MLQARDHLEQLKVKRQNWVNANEINGFKDGIENLLTDLYPDKAHFIYELLQNAEDTKASEVKFNLYTDKLVVTHDGKPFTNNNVEAITSIGTSTKKDDYNQIGKFGVGFKAVFAYTKTPRIYSGDFAFEIRDLVVPHSIQEISHPHGKTIFEFPFNQPKKDSELAFKEISQSLSSINSQILLFLSNIKSVEWIISNGNLGFINSKELYSDIKEVSNDKGEKNYYLKFSQIKSGFDVSVAFELKLLKKEIKPSLAVSDIANYFSIVAVKNSPISVYFPTQQQSGLFFHINAPFSATVARDNIADSEGNRLLMSYIGELIAQKMPFVKSMGLLTTSFLTVLPNKNDILSKEKGVTEIRDKIIKAFLKDKLVPTNNKTYCFHTMVLNASPAIKTLFSVEDLSFLSNKKYKHWVASSNNNERFTDYLKTINVDTWTSLDIIEQIKQKLGPYSEDSNHTWLLSKSDKWLQELYLFLSYVRAKNINDTIANQLSDCFFLPFIDKDNSRKLCQPIKTYFAPTNNLETNPFQCVPITLFKHIDEANLKRLKYFLRECGVKDINEEEIIKKILNIYKLNHFEVKIIDHLDHVNFFIKFFSNNIDNIYTLKKIFHNSQIVVDENNKLITPNKIFIDKPYQKTEISLVNKFLPSHLKKNSLALLYKDKMQDKDLLLWIKLLKVLGAQVALEIKVLSVYDTLNIKLVHSYNGVRETHTGTDIDWTIDGLESLIKANDKKIALMIWESMNESSSDNYKAMYCPNQQYRVKVDESYLINLLKTSSWIPAKDGKFHKPSDMRSDMLIKGFNYDEKKEWLNIVGFDKENAENKRRKKKYTEDAKKIGLDIDEEGLELLSSFSKDEIKATLLDAKKKKDSIELPKKTITNTTEYKRKADEIANTSPKQRSEARARTLRVSVDKKQVKEYLFNVNTNSKKHVICQMCHKRMPFQLEGEDYFESIEFIKTSKEYVANHLALCPNCAAEFKFACTDNNEAKTEKIIDLDESDSESILRIEINSPLNTSIRFTQQHLIDLKAVLDDQ